MRSGVTKAQKAEAFEAWGMELAPRPEPKRKPKPEDVLHINVASYLRRAIGHEGWLCAGPVVWWSQESRNAGKTIVTKSGKEINLEGINRKNRGCIAGLPDVSILCNGRLHGIELKAGKNGTSDKQDDLHVAWRGAGAPVAVCRTLDEVEVALRGWGVPIRASVSA